MIMSDSDPGYGIEDASPVPPPLLVTPPPRIMPGVHEIPPIAPDTAVCMQCGYALRGLDTTRNCPECGAPIRRSLMGNLLEFSSVDYVRNLHRGVVMILVTTLVQIAVGIVGSIIMLVMVFTSAAAAAASGTAPPFNPVTLQIWISAITLPFTALLLLGWWLFSAPDPAILGAEQGQKPRLIIRITIAVMAALSVLDLVVKTLPTSSIGGDLTSAGVVVLIGIAGFVQFFASVLYVRWLAPRIPDLKLYEQTRLYLWLLPLIYVVGMICLGLGPLVAGIMYLLMLNTVRLRLQTIMRLPQVD